ncbi:DUF6602 domain-containing protein [Vallitalea guaymasensis]|uniref:DUF6602 domain-containing protein n=1 Tax=Vallitalea guaymasensis TaxID=1185412 RepID=UPI002357D66B|nr:DUF6602 domain-containing protein [Vallitalea guaymasensis]
MGNKNVFDNISMNYEYMNKMMVKEIKLASEHNGLTGSFREDMWLDFFRRIVPKKFALSKGVIIIDSKGNSSKEVDICIYDEQYTPYVFQYNNLKFIPIEAVAVAIQCKSTSIDDKDLKEWSKSIKRLQSNCSGIARMATGHTIQATNQTQKKTTPIIILTSLFENPKNKKESVEIERLRNYYDFILSLEIDEKDEIKEEKFKLTVNYENNSLGWWSEKLNNNKYNTKIDLSEENYDKEENKVMPISLIGSIDDNTYDILEKKLNLFYKIKKIKERDTKVYSSKVTLKDFRVEGNDILSLNLQLNQLLMLLNNPMLFPHYAYAKVFNTFIEKNAIKI